MYFEHLYFYLILLKDHYNYIHVGYSLNNFYFYNDHINHNYTSWIGAIATVWKYIGVDIYGFAYTKEFKFESVLKHIKGELL